jgi:hypothetical protein
MYDIVTFYINQFGNKKYATQQAKICDKKTICWDRKVVWVGEDIFQTLVGCTSSQI